MDARRAKGTEHPNALENKPVSWLGATPLRDRSALARVLNPAAGIAVDWPHSRQDAPNNYRESPLACRGSGHCVATAPCRVESVSDRRVSSHR